MNNEELDIAALRNEFARDRIVTIDSFLDEISAAQVEASIVELREEFLLRVRNGTYPRTLTFHEPLSPTRGQALEDQLTVARNRGLFTYIYYLFEPHANCSAHAVCRLTQFLASEKAVRLMERITGDPVVKCEVAGITRYHRGHYLGAHSDRLAKFGNFQRKVAFCLYFCRNWTEAHGGLLALAHGNRVSHQVPGFNRMVLFDVDTVGKHWVTRVEDGEARRINMPGFFCLPIQPEAGGSHQHNPPGSSCEVNSR